MPETTTDIDAALSSYWAQHLSKLAPSGAKQRMRHLQKSFKGLMDKPVSEIRQSDLVVSVDAASDGARNNVIVSLTHFFKFCRQREWTTLRPEFEAARKRYRDVVLDIDTIRRLWDAAEDMTYYRGFCRLLILTGQRRNEVRTMRPADVNLHVRKQLWTLAKTKNSQPHVVHLAPACMMELIAATNPQSDVYPWTDRNSFGKLKVRWSAAAGVPHEEWRFHDLRRSFATHLAEDGVPGEVVDLILNHQPSATRNMVARIYNRSKLLEAREAAMRRYQELLGL